MIAIIDYGMGNLRSVQKALEVVGGKTRIVDSASGLKRCDKIVFPGVGAFGAAMAELKKRGLAGAIREEVAEGKYFLGLCLGLQLLFEKSEEAPGVKGLGILAGSVKRFRFSRSSAAAALKVPHMGWNTIEKKMQEDEPGAKVLAGIDDGAYVYFVHSYYVVPQDKRIVLSTTNYGIDLVSGVAKDNVIGLQFHPEKSQAVGLKILKNFVRL